ncbi:MAG: hypothetical protein HDKAJFGB_01017 [Anaerolineae bacterium]|nr:hypothetical protein [Anaerolineae bacterium]
MLLKSIIGVALRRRAPNVSAKRVVHPLGLIPTLYAVRRVCHDDVEFSQFVVFQKLRRVQRVALCDLKFIYVVHEHIDSGNGRRNQVQFLPKEFERAVFLALLFEMQRAVEQNSAASAGRVVHAFAWLRVGKHRHQFYDGAVGIKLGGGMSAVIGKFLDQIFVTFAHDVVRHLRNGQLVF